MGRKRRPNEKSSYVKKPEVPETLADRAAVITAVLAKQLAISEGAAKLGIARGNMQTLVHKAEAALIAALSPQAPGPAPKPAVVAKLEAELEAARQENQKLASKVQTLDGLLGISGGIIRDLRGLPPRPGSRTSSPNWTRSSPKSTADAGDPEPEDPEPPPTLKTLLMAVTTMREARPLIARCLGVCTTTVMRWAKRLARGEPPWRKRGARPKPVAPEAEATIRERVRELHGLIGADALAHSVEGVSRRTAAAIKQDEITAVERERKAECQRVQVLAPGVIRGFDAMHVNTDEGWHYALIAGDGSMPYRTSAIAVETYDSASVASALEADFTAHGAPLVCRMDRARSQRTPEVLSVLERHSVLLLEGPPHYPYFYSQLERQNREHRGWLDALGQVVARCLGTLLLNMRTAMNHLWPRRMLGWRTAAEAWDRRHAVSVDRAALKQEVERRAAALCAKDVEKSLAMRLAIEQALIEIGYLVITRRKGAM